MSNRRILKKKLARAKADSRTMTDLVVPAVPTAPPSILSERRSLCLPRTRFRLENVLNGRRFGVRSVLSRYGTDADEQHIAKLNVEMPCQERTNWCWAAASSFCAYALHRQRRHWSLCMIANVALQRTDCCTDTSDNVNLKAQLSIGLRAVECNAGRHVGAERFEQIEQHIKDEQPVIVRFGYSGGGGHVFAIYGCTWGAEQLVHVHDSLYGETNGIPYESLKHSYLNDAGTWTDTYLVT